MNTYDVLVVGAGPAGSRVAYRLAALGKSVVVFEKHAYHGEGVCCTGIISRECFERFQIGQECVLEQSNSAKIFAPSGEFIRIVKDEVQAYIVDRPGLNRYLAMKAEAAGAKYLLSSPVKEITVSQDGVDVHLDQGEVYRGKVVVVASGFHTKLTSKLGLGRIDKFVAGAQAEVETSGVTEVEVYFSQKIAPKFFAWLVPVSPSTARVGLCTPSRPGHYLRELIDKLIEEGKVKPSRNTMSYGGIPLKTLSSTIDNRIVVVGDAAGQVKPTTGGGIYFGLICADFAARVLEQAFSDGDFSRRMLEQYETAWKSELGKELRVDGLARSLYNRLSDRQINKIFGVVRDRRIHETLLNSPNQSFDWHGDLFIEAMKRLGPWRHLFGRHVSNPLVKLLGG